MMQYLPVYLFALFVVVVAKPQDTYTTKYDGVDVDEILKSDRLFNNYYKCLMGTGKCTPDGSELKRVLPDALVTNCSKCSDKQKSGTDRVIKFLIEKKPTQWEALQTKYDPENIYLSKFRADAEKIGIHV